MSEYTEIETDEGTQLSFLEVPSQDDFSSDIPEDVADNDNVDMGQSEGQESFFEDDIPENTAEIEGENKPNSEYVKIGSESVNPESPYVIKRETAEDSGYIEGNNVIDSDKAKEELALPNSNSADTVHDMDHISEDTHDLYVSDVAPTKENDDFSKHEGGGEQTIAIRKEGEFAEGYVLDEKSRETPVYEPEHSPGEEGVTDDRKQLEDFSNADWESAYTENEMYASVRDHNEHYQDNQLNFYEISNSGENFERADGESAFERAKERDFKSI